MNFIRLQRFIQWLLMLSVLAWSPLGNANQPAVLYKHIHFACTEPADSPIFQLLHRIYTKAFDDQGIRFSMSYAPDKRALSEVSLGRIDGHCGKITPPNQSLLHSTITSKTIISFAEMVVLSHQKSSVQSLTDLSANAFRVGAVSGNSLAITLDQLSIPYINIVEVDRGIRMLAGNRLDYVVSNQFQIKRILAKTQIDTPLFVTSLREKLPIRTLLHQKHAGLMETLDISLQGILDQHGGQPISSENLPLWLNTPIK